MMRRLVLAARYATLAIGFKILTDVFAFFPQPLRFKEFGLPFSVAERERQTDSVRVGLTHAAPLDKLIAVGFRCASRVSSSNHGVAVHFAVLTLVFQGLHRGFVEVRQRRRWACSSPVRAVAVLASSPAGRPCRLRDFSPTRAFLIGHPRRRPRLVPPHAQIARRHVAAHGARSSAQQRRSPSP